MPCTNPLPVGGEDSGTVRCAEGYVRRTQAGRCADNIARPVLCGEVECEGDYPYCDQGGQVAYCSTGCLEDTDCPAGTICVCGADVGRCIEAECTSDADCTPGFHCADATTSLACGRSYKMTCQASADECVSDQDCGGMMPYCGPGADHRVCQEESAVCGRPFLVAGAARLAPVEASSDWAAEVTVDLRGLDPEARAAIAAQWTELGTMEHASVAAFARFALQLLALGAPRTLLEGATAAMADETRHAELCFGLASAYAGTPVGPGPLPVDGALERIDLEQTVRDAFLEGCLGETLAALEAAEALELARDPAARSALERIIADESRHAALAWRFVAWALAERPALTTLVRHLHEAQVRARLGRAAPLSSAPPATSSALAGAGLLDPNRRARVQQRALDEVVTPCLEALLGTVEHRTRAQLRAS